ncbi:Uncharacterised protein [Pandoraea pulmonicola]|uniref:Uncharacterized protein n=1 Tax=Pandoraea pulmonicola TaxID=93221 RepID=A0AAJ4ZD30_PANPU|nr:Uncharacterised protein [Pandoraea pulmonicola]
MQRKGHHETARGDSLFPPLRRRFFCPMKKGLNPVFRIQPLCGGRWSVAQITPCANMASATFTKPATLAPFT